MVLVLASGTPVSGLLRLCNSTFACSCGLQVGTGTWLARHQGAVPAYHRRTGPLETEPAFSARMRLGLTSPPGPVISTAGFLAAGAGSTASFSATGPWSALRFGMAAGATRVSPRELCAGAAQARKTGQISLNCTEGCARTRLAAGAWQARKRRASVAESCGPSVAWLIGRGFCAWNTA